MNQLQSQLPFHEVGCSEASDTCALVERVNNPMCSLSNRSSCFAENYAIRIFVRCQTDCWEGGFVMLVLERVSHHYIITRLVMLCNTCLSKHRHCGACGQLAILNQPADAVVSVGSPMQN